MNPAIMNLVISLGAMQLARKVPFDNPDVLLGARVGYVTSQLLIMGVYLYISALIKKKDDKTVIKYVEGQNPMSQDSGELVTTTVRDYDLAETSKLVRATYMGVAMMGFLHIYMKFNPPLFIQALMGLKGLYDAKPVAIYIFGKPAEGDLKRPWKAGGGLFGGGEPQTDKAAIDAAEKKVQKKDE